jgi:ribose transport system permease protein
MPDNTTVRADQVNQPVAPADVVSPGPTRNKVAPSQSLLARISGNSFVAKYGLLVAFILMLIIFSVAKPHIFPTYSNFKSVLTQAAPPMILAIGLTVVLAMQDFDLSFGSMIGLGGGAVTIFMTQDHWSWVLAIIVVLAMGIAVGVANGIMVAYFGGSSFIITLAMGTVLTGIEYAFTKQNTVFAGFPHGFISLATNTSGGYSNQIWIALVVVILAWLLLDHTEIGRYMYAVGGNQEASRLSGLRVRPLRVLGFVVMGLMAAVVGVILISESGSYSPNAGVPYLLPAFAAAFLGAAVFRPGEFNIPGTVVGVLFLQVISTGLVMLNLQTYLINLVQGGILIIAVLVSRLGQRA